MSSFLVDDQTINRIVSEIYHDQHAGASWTRRKLTEAFGIPQNGNRDDNAAQLGKLMFDLNISAVNARYGEGQAADFRPLTYRYSYTPVNTYQVLKSLQCWLYQCTEGDTEQQELYKIMGDYAGSLAMQIISRTPQYEAAEWG